MTGVTEPLEFSFLFAAPLLYAVHALLTGASMAITWTLGVHAGFSFSGGLIDYVVNWHLDTKPWLIIPIGLCFAVMYYVIFRVAITAFGIPTPGREPEELGEDIERGTTSNGGVDSVSRDSTHSSGGPPRVTTGLHLSVV